MSRVGAGGVAAIAYLFAGLLFAHALGWRAAETSIFRLLLVFVVLTAIIALRDYARDRKRI
jgi:amino acid permease